MKEDCANCKANSEGMCALHRAKLTSVITQVDGQVWYVPFESWKRDQDEAARRREYDRRYGKP